jgi:hypothetical protein
MRMSLRSRLLLSPDGKQVAYPIDREPRGSIWRVEIPGLAKP